jgi:hypothetical protein
MRVPHEYFVRFLITCGKTLVEVNQDLASFGFLPLDPDEGGDYYEWLKKELALPEDFQPRAKGHVPSQRFLMRTGLKEIWLQDQFPHVQAAFQLLAKPLIRKSLEALTISPVSYEEMVELFKEKFGFVVSKSTLRAYTHYFNNYHLLSLEEMKTHIIKSKEFWKMSVMDGDTDLLRFQLGLRVRVASSNMVEDIVHLAYFRGKDAKHMPQTLGTAEQVGIYAKVIDWGLQQRVKGEDQAGELTKALAVDYIDETPPILDGESRPALPAEAAAPGVQEETQPVQQEEDNVPATPGPQ